LILYSDGKLEVEQEADFLEPTAMYVLDVTDAASIEYSGGRYVNRMLYQLLNSLSALSAFVILAMSTTWFEFVFEGRALTPQDSLSFATLVVWIFFDIFRGELASPERLKFTLSDGSSKQIYGELPDGYLHGISTFFVCLGLAIFLLCGLFWAEERAPTLGDILFYAIAIVLSTFFLVRIMRIFSDDKELTGIDSADVPNGLTHMYFAVMSLRSARPAAQRESDITSKELQDIRERLSTHAAIISSIVSANDIFTAPSPSLGVLAIRVSTETIMRHACDNVGIVWKPNARPTLESYVQKYGSQKELDSRTRSYLENIREMGNRAAHDFNLDWDEFKIALNQFCEIVGWYSVNFDDADESE
jgi:hypothetical protein